MFETFLYAFHAVMPMLLIMLLGFIVRRIGPWDGRFFKQVNKLCFHLFLPLSLALSVYNIQDLTAINWPALLFLPFCVLLCAGMGWVAARFLVPRRNQKGVILQAAYRSNQSFLGLPLASALGIEGAVAFASVAIALCIPLFNILSVVCLSYYSDREGVQADFRSMVRGVLTNPLVVGILTAICLVVIRQFLPTVDGVPVFSIARNLPSVYTAISNLAKVASPMMLFVLGTNLDLGSTRSILKELSLGLFLRLIAAPVLALSLFLLLRGPLGITPVEIPALLASFATPVAVSTPVMTQEIGGDEQLAGQLVVWSSLLSMFTIFCFIFLLRSFGVL